VQDTNGETTPTTKCKCSEGQAGVDLQCRRCMSSGSGGAPTVGGVRMGAEAKWRKKGREWCKWR